MIPLRAPLGSIGSGVAAGAKRAAYGAAQAARILWFTGHYAAGRRLMGPLTDPGEAPYAEEFSPVDRTRLRKSFRDLFRADWANIASGAYRTPRELARLPSLPRLMKLSRDYFIDARKVAERKHARGHSEVLTADARAKYPRYYLQNFHYQTDGWLSDASAERYDMQVETLFTGAASAMRRQALPFVRTAINGRDPGAVALLDLGCGTGGFLSDIKHNWPSIDATALDLSPAYLGKARARLGAQKSIRFVEAPAEATGLADASIDIVTAVYLFHELPPAVRAVVAAEIARVLKPGGTLIEVDTLQYGDETGFDVLLETFPRGFHEPYYDSYCRTDLGALFGAAGLEKTGETLAFLTKVTAFTKARQVAG